MPGEPIESPTERADRAMCAAKAAGRDRTVIGEPPGPFPRDIVGILRPAPAATAASPSQ